jgi:hypothetical protein
MQGLTTHLPEARRWPGSEWLKDHPRALEQLYRLTERLLRVAYPLLRRFSPPITNQLLLSAEHVSKGYLFNCQMCGQCILHSTGMTCPMTCPKNLRNGPCGGVRANGNCEIKPEMKCVWADAYAGSLLMKHGERILVQQPPIDHRMKGSSSWLREVRRKSGDAGDRETPV